MIKKRKKAYLKLPKPCVACLQRDKTRCSVYGGPDNELTENSEDVTAWVARCKLSGWAVYKKVSVTTYYASSDWKSNVPNDEPNT